MKAVKWILAVASFCLGCFIWFISMIGEGAAPLPPSYYLLLTLCFGFPLIVLAYSIYKR
jgi:uncharacterized membrane protein